MSRRRPELSPESRSMVLAMFGNEPGCEWVLEDMEDSDVPFIAGLFWLWWLDPEYAVPISTSTEEKYERRGNESGLRGQGRMAGRR